MDFIPQKKKINISSIIFESLPYSLNDEGYIDYEEMEKLAKKFCPKLIIAGGSAYPRDWDYKRMRKIADEVDAYLLCDMSHYSGLVAAKEQNDPFEYCDMVTSTTHKSLRGPRAGMIFSKKVKLKESDIFMHDSVDQAVFPTCQGGPHNHQIAAICTQMKEVCSDEWIDYAKQIKANTKALCETLIELGHKLMTNGSDNHLLLWNLRDHKITGSKIEYACELANITVNKNTVKGDKNAMSPYGIRLGTPALTSRGFVEKDFKEVAKYLDTVLKISLQVQSEHKTVSLEDFKSKIFSNEELKNLKKNVINFAIKFKMPGFDVSEMKYKSIDN